MRLPIRFLKPARPLCSWFTPLVCLALLAVIPGRAAGVETPWVMYGDPVLKRPSIEMTFPRELVERWLQALARPEREMKRQAAFAIAEAVPRGVPGLAATIDPLCEVLGKPDQDRIVRLTVARALVALDARRAAPQLIEASGPNDLEMAEVVEPALTRWKETGLRDRWMERLNGEIGLRRPHVLAIRGLVALGERESLPRLLELAMDPYAASDVRLEAADGLGVLQESGLLESARTLAEDQTVGALVDRMVAARMLAGHRGEDTEKLLVALATDPSPSVRTVALSHLFRIDPSLILAIIDSTVGSKDANVRRWGAEALVAKPSPELLAVLGLMLDDRDPDVRHFVCDSLVNLAEAPTLHDAVIEQGRRILNGEAWRGQEQATLLLVTLEDKTIVDRLIELLDVDRPEANVAAAWGLCQLAVPATAEPLFDVFQRKTDSTLAGEPRNGGLADQLALLAQALGVMKYSPADSVLHKYVPKNCGLDEVSRMGAIWALGHLYAGQPDEKLTALLKGRVLDAFSMEPEVPGVCRMSAVSLGRMKATSVVPSLQSAFDQTGLGTELGYACAWAIRQLTGEEVPVLPPTIDQDRDWFLVPTGP